MDKIKKQEPLTAEQEREIVTHLLTKYYAFESYTPLGTDIEPNQYWFLDVDGNELAFDGGYTNLKELFEKLRGDLEYAEYEIDNFELHWIQTMVHLGTYAK